MGKKKKVAGVAVEEENKEGEEGKNLLGEPTFKQLENGRFKCVETGHELTADARASYAHSKHCRLGLIESALARSKPPLNMFQQDPQSRSRLICKLTGHNVNKTEEHIWKHINGKRFLSMLEKKEAEAEKLEPSGIMEEDNEQKPAMPLINKEKALKKKEKKKKKQEENITDTELVYEMRNSSCKDSDSEEDDFWMPPVGDRWDFDDGRDRWGSDSDSGLETDDANQAGGAGEDNNFDADHTGDLSKRTKRMSIEIGPSAFASRKKKKKIQSTE